MNKRALTIISIIIVVLPLYHLTVVEGATFEKSVLNIDTEAKNYPLVTANIIWNAEQDNFNTNFQSILDECDARSSFAPQKHKVIVNDLEINDLSRKVTKNSTSDFEKAYEIYNYVTGRYDYQIYSEWRDTKEILRTNTGDCTDQSILIVSLLKNSGIDSYIVHGREIRGYTHAWVVANIDGKWLQMDATTNDFYYVENCLKDETCGHRNLYNIAGLFTDGVSLECSNS